MWRIWAAALFWGLNWPIIKVLLTGANPWTLRAAGLSAGAVLLAGATIVSRQSLCIERRYWGALLVAGLLNVAAFNVLAVFAQMSMTASRAAILTYTMPLWSVLFARVVLAEPIDVLRGLALLPRRWLLGARLGCQGDRRPRADMELLPAAEPRRSRRGMRR